MRQNRFIATKDHFIMLAASNEIGDELWAGHVEFRNRQFDIETSNALGFIVRGSANAFHNSSNTGEVWAPYESASAPLLLIRKNFVDFGIVSTSNNRLFGSILEKDSVLSGQSQAILVGNLNVDELNKLATAETVNAEKKCKVYQKRDVDTFELIPQEDLDINVILDSEIEVDGV